MRRTILFVDGFNLYHGLCQTRRNELKWLSLSDLAKRLVPARSHKIENIYYFTAIAEHLPDRAARHQVYIQALRAEGVVPILGEFKDKDRFTRCCFGCKHKETIKEEKQTDVNIAIWLVGLAYRNAFDTAILVTADSDLTPLVWFMKTKFPEKELILATPPYRGSDTLRQACDQRRKIRVQMVASCLLPASLRAKDGTEIVRPTEYDPA